MTAEQRNVIQFTITLLDIEPAIWRRIQVPETYSFWDLHVAIQDAMGWLDCHLHGFEVIDPSAGQTVQLGIPDEDGWDEMLPGWKHKIADFFRQEHDRARYIYDFGDGWDHAVVMEKRLPAQPRRRYPVCTAGARRCPHEDCGGVWGYQELLEAIDDVNHQRHGELLEWVGGTFDSEAFDPKAVRFDDPSERRKLLQH